jgi:hypothetical protein
MRTRKRALLSPYLPKRTPIYQSERRNRSTVPQNRQCGVRLKTVANIRSGSSLSQATSKIGWPFGNQVPFCGLFLLARISAIRATAKGLVNRLI